MTEIIETEFKNCFVINLKEHNDIRGSFTKVFEEDTFKKNGLETQLSEIYYTSSNKNVIRGMHFQSPPKDHAKLVHCIYGEVLDVIVDLRKESETYRRSLSFHLKGSNKQALYIPKGMAHGFLSLSDNSTLIYSVTSTHDVEHDTGILWSSIDFNWPIQKPIVSQRDQNFKSISEFDSPF